MTKEATIRALKARFCENCWVYNELFFKTGQDAEKVIKHFGCKLEITLDTNRNFQIKIPESLGCENFVPEEQQLPIEITLDTNRNFQIKIPESLGCENFVPEEQQLPIKHSR